MWVCNPPTPFKFYLRQSTSARGTKSLLRERSRYRLNSGGGLLRQGRPSPPKLQAVLAAGMIRVTPAKQLREPMTLLSVSGHSNLIARPELQINSVIESRRFHHGETHAQDDPNISSFGAVLFSGDGSIDRHEEPSHDRPRSPERQHVQRRDE